MWARESDIYTPEPRDEYRKVRRSSVSTERVDIWFESFRLAQSMGMQSYWVNLKDKTWNEKQDLLLIYLTQYISDIELWPIERNKDWVLLFEKDRYPEKRKEIYGSITDPCILFFNKIEEKFPEFWAIQDFNIDKWILSLSMFIPPKTELQILKINLSETLKKNSQWKFIFDEKGLEKELKWRTRQNLDALKQSLETESLFGWAIVISYEKIENTKKGIVYGLSWLSTLDIAYRVRKLIFRDELGKMQEVDPQIVKNILKWIGDKTRINSLLFKVMQATGRVYNPIRNTFTDLNTLGIDRATERVKSMQRTEIEKWRNMTDAEFEAERARVIAEIARTPRSVLIKNAWDFLKWIPWYAQHYLFWWVFFAEYQKNTYDIANMYRGLADTWLFYAGMNIAGWITPGIWKMPGWLIGGGLAVLGGHVAGWAMWLDKKMWRMMPERVATDGKKSLIMHGIGGGITNDIVDVGNTDLGIPGTRGWAVVYNPLGKDGIMPNVDFARTNIDFWVNPREYLQSRIEGTDTHWNKRIDQYVKWATDEVMRVLYEFEKERWYFVPGNGDKNKLLRERLRHIFDGDEGKNKRNTMIVEDCIDYVSTRLIKIPDLAVRKEMLSLFLGNYGNILKIDEASLKYDDSLLERDKIILDGHTMNYLTLLSPEKRVFAEKLFTRLQKWEILVDGKIIQHRWDMIGQEVSVFRADKRELALYQSLFDDTSLVKQEWYDILGYQEYTYDGTKAGITWLDNKYGLAVGSSLTVDEWIISRGLWSTLRANIIEWCASVDQDFAKKYEQIRKTLKTYPTVPLQIPQTQKVILPTGTFYLHDILRDYSALSANLYKKNVPPTLGDAFVHLLNMQTENREQQKYIKTQKSIGYANKWKFF